MMRRCAAVACGLAVLVACCIGITSVAAYAVGPAQVPYTQVFTTDDSSADANFTYTLTAQDYTAATPMPAGSSAGVYTFTVNGNASGSIDWDVSSAPNGTYVYKVADASTHKTGYTYEARTYTVELYVTSGTAQVIVKRDIDNMKVSALEMDPSYKSTGSPDVLVDKEVDAKQIAPGQLLTYTITATNVGTAPTKDGAHLLDIVPDHTTFVSAADGGVYGVASDGHEYVSWYFDELNPGQSVSGHFTVRVDECDDGTGILNVANFSPDGQIDPEKVIKGEVGGNVTTTSNTVASKVESSTPSAPQTPQKIASSIASGSAKTGDGMAAVGIVGVAIIAAVMAFIAYRRRSNR